VNGAPKPNIQTYTAVIDSYGKAGNLPKAIDLFESMHRGVNDATKPNTTTYNVVMDTYGKAGNLPKAIVLFESMQKGVNGAPKPDIQSYNTILDPYAKSNKMRQASSLLEVMQQNIDGAPSPDEFSYASMIDMYSKNGQVNSAVGIFESMHVPPVIVLLSAVHLSMFSGINGRSFPANYSSFCDLNYFICRGQNSGAFFLKSRPNFLEVNFPLPSLAQPNRIPQPITS
jgi:pentatricopeptide repeat protein